MSVAAPSGDAAGDPAPAEGSARHWTLCADDFGLSEGINQGIAELALAGRVNAVSCITNSPCWAAGVRLLAGAPSGLSLGLHVNLTEGRPLSGSLGRVWPRLPGLAQLMLRAHLARLPLAALRDELKAQLDAFRAATGRWPQHVDGHQHVHHLPGLRTALLEMLRGIHPRPLVRSAAQLGGPGFVIKRRVIRHSGAIGLQGALCREAWPHNTLLLGAYDFRARDYGHLMRQWLARLPPQGGWVFCHPGVATLDGDADPIAAARIREHAYLGGDAFVQDMARARACLGQHGSAESVLRQMPSAG